MTEEEYQALPDKLKLKTARGWRELTEGMYKLAMEKYKDDDTKELRN